MYFVREEGSSEGSSEDALIIHLHWKRPQIKPPYSVILLAESLPADINSYSIEKTENPAVYSCFT